MIAQDIGTSSSKTVRVKKAPLTITDFAITKVKELIEKRSKPSLGIRVTVKSGGCNGKTYSIEYADEERLFEEVLEQGGVKVYIDPKAIIYLIGSEMDFVEEQFKSGFTFKNPNEKSRCGCGDSFNV
jgi:iron-sulfur cluster assembly protein